MISIPSVLPCTDTALTADQTRLPTMQAELDPADNIPLMAVSTGALDALECVLLKIGINQNQFSNPARQGGNGRVRFYTGEGVSDAGVPAGPGAQYPGSTPSATQLWGTQDEINQYDMVFFPCQGVASAKTAAQQQIVIDYANAGGRVFATHYSYVWLYDDNPFNGTATWNVGQGFNGQGARGLINMNFPLGQTLAQWLKIVGASTTLGQIPLNTLREDFDGVNAPSLLWVQLDAAGGGWPMLYTFDTPVGKQPSMQCGRVLFDDFHVENNIGDTGQIFPNECPDGAMTAQEKLLEFMIFDLGACFSGQ
jgi:hypothetical protein